MRRRALLCCAWLLVMPWQGVWAEAPIRVFAAASLASVLEELSAHWPGSHGSPLSVTAAGSGVLARQVLAGAPADVYLSADRRWSDSLVADGLVAADAVTAVASNVLVLIAPRPSDVLADVDVLDRETVATALAEAISRDARARVAIGLREAVPAGRYATEVLQSLELEAEFSSRLVETDNVRAALRLVARQEAALGFVYETDARAESSVHTFGRFDAGAHSAIEYQLVVLNERADVMHFADWLSGDAARKIWQSHGFLPADAAGLTR